MTVSFFLLIAALVCFLLATFGAYGPGDGAGWHRIGFGWLGAALITITLLLGAH